MIDIGHNSNAIATGQLRSFVDRLSRLEDEKAEVSEQIKEVGLEAKGQGFDVATLKKIVKLSRQDAAKRASDKALLDLYATALGLDDIV